jgi:hypothetical protein
MASRSWMSAQDMREGMGERVLDVRTRFKAESFVDCALAPRGTALVVLTLG